MSGIATTNRIGSMIEGGNAQAAHAEVIRNPADLDDRVTEVELAPATVLVEACRAARGAQDEWQRVPPPVRGRVIEQLGRLVEENKEALARLLTREIGKPFVESLGEVQEVIDTCTFFAGEGRRLYGQTVPSEMLDKQLFTFRVPVGVFAVITAGNFPVAVPSWYIVPALVAGNAVVWKPAEYAPAISQAFAQLIREAGAPPAVMQVVFADGPATFEGLEGALEGKFVDKVGFTGSTAVGSRIGALCGAHLQSPCLELGGKNPLVVMPDANVPLAVDGALFSGFGTAGQRCTSLGTAIVHEQVYDEFVRLLTERVEGAAVGDPMADVLYGPMMNERFLGRFENDWLSLIESHHSLHGSSGTGRITESNPRAGFVGDSPERGLYAHPTIVADARPEDKLLSTETFGPMVAIARFGDWEEAIALANGHGYGLSASIYTRDPRYAFEFRQRCGAGMVSINNSTSGAEAHLPFGGNGRSGNGSRQSGIWVLDQVTRWQAMNWDYSDSLQRAQIDTPQQPQGS
jgi:acyl-CoA reductase-like NAD-dependent aldehyde dehydrogenase